MKEFKVGDRVALYLNDARVTGKITEIDGWKIRVLWKHPSAGNVYGWHHVKQCRRLVKKKRREWFMVFDHDQDNCPYVYPSQETAKDHIPPAGFMVHVREVKP